MGATVLIIAEEAMARLLRDCLRASDLSITIRNDGVAGLGELASSHYDLVLLDMQEPTRHEFDLIQNIRRVTASLLVVLSDSDADEDMILGLGIGADQFITKPFVRGVLVARVRALLRWTGERNQIRGGIRFADYVLDIEGKMLRRGKERVPLSAKELAVLCYLASRPGVAIAPDIIYADIWDKPEGEATAVAVYIQRLRRKIELDPSNPQIIQTVHGSGYRFTARLHDQHQQEATRTHATPPQRVDGM